MRGRTVELVMVTGLLLAGAQAHGGCGSLYDDLYAPLTETGGGGTGGTGAGAGPTTGVGGCLIDSDCKDDNDCTIDTCVFPTCEHENDPYHVPAQDDGDCRTRVCKDGNVVEESDDTDLPIDDDTCRAYSCTDGVPDSAPENEGWPCQDDHGKGTCNNGLCRHAAGVPCDGAADCYAPACVDGVCCTEQCQDQCDSCNQPGLVGSCATLPGGAEDLEGDTPCQGNHACAPGGVCVELKSNGEPCMSASECGSGSCAVDVAGLPSVCKLSYGNRCAESAECCSGSCVNNFCQAVSNATINSLCDGFP